MGSRKGGFDEANLTLASGVLAFTQGKVFVSEFPVTSRLLDLIKSKDLNLTKC